MGPNEAQWFAMTSQPDTTADAGPGSLRQAITDANDVSTVDTPGPVTISFDLDGAGPHTISPVDILPAITRPVVLDGYTQPLATPNTNDLWEPSNADIRFELIPASSGLVFLRFGFLVDEVLVTALHAVPLKPRF